MTIEGGLTFEFGDGRSPDHIRFVLGDEHLGLLRGFVAEAMALVRLVQGWGGIQASYGISVRVGEPVQVRTSELSAEKRAALLHHLRPFILHNEPYHFHTVRGIVARSSDSPSLKMFLREIRDQFRGERIRRQFNMASGDLVVNSEAALEHWLNGFEYHRDSSRAAHLESASDPFGIESIRPIFLMLLSEKVEAIGILADVVATMLTDPTVPASSTQA